MTAMNKMSLSLRNSYSTVENCNYNGEELTHMGCVDLCHPLYTCTCTHIYTQTEACKGIESNGSALPGDQGRTLRCDLIK